MAKSNRASRFSHDERRAPLSVPSAPVTAPSCFFRSIGDEVKELDRLLETLLLAARADAGPVNTAPSDLADLAARATVRLPPFAISRSVRMTSGIAAASVIVGDADILERVVVSLLHNGIKFSPPNGTVSLCVRDLPTTVSLFIRDEGPGFSDEALAHAFDRFWKDDAARGRSGTGLGLAIARSAVERVGGSITIRNARTGGAEIETIFPHA